MNPEIAQLVEETAEILDRGPLDQMQSTEATLRALVKQVALELALALDASPYTDARSIIRQQVGLL